MLLLKREKNFIGLDIGKYAIKVVEFSKKNEDIFLKNFAYSLLSFEAIVDEMIINSNEIIERLKKLIKFYKIKTKSVAIAIAGNSVIIKKLSIGGETFDDIKNQIINEAPNHIPYNINEVEIAFHIFEENEEHSEKSEVLLIAVKKEILDDYVTILIESRLKPEVADVDFFALQNIFEFNYKDEIDPEETVALLNIGANICNIIILKNFKSLFYRDANIGNFQGYERLQSNLNISYEEIEKMKLENTTNMHIKKFIESTNKKIVSDISKGIDLFLTSAGIDKVNKIFLSGGGALHKGMKQILETRYKDAEISYLDPFKKIIIDDKNFDLEYINYIKPQFCIAAGLALRGINGQD